MTYDPGVKIDIQGNPTMNLLKTMIEQAATLVALGLFLATIFLWCQFIAEHARF